MQLGRWEDAISAFNHALEIEPAHSQAREKRTEARQKLGDSTADPGMSADETGGDNADEE
jgi:hypothetical protein